MAAEGGGPSGPLPVCMLLPMHGPVVDSALTQLLVEYRWGCVLSVGQCCWSHGACCCPCTGRWWTARSRSCWWSTGGAVY